MAQLTDRQRIAHLLRRFGLGALPEEVDALAKLGPDGALDYLLNFDKVDEGFPVSPLSACWEEGLPDLYLDSYRPAIWWSLRLVMTKRPLQEKLTLFWHNHFAVSGAKVEIGPMMLQYLEVLRSGGLGKFDDLLASVSKSPAMITWLDTNQNQKGSPNENFAREVIELFTLGIGHYTEQDVKEAARAFTGWGIRYLIIEQGAEKYMETSKALALAGKPLFAFSISPDLHDDGPKTILGEKKNWSGDDVIKMLAGRPETARLIARKLWSFFAYQNPEPQVVERLAKVYMDSGHMIKPMLEAIAKSPEFWSDKCLRQQVKSPVDFNYTIGRQLGLGPFLQTQHPNHPVPEKPLPKPLKDIAGVMFSLSEQQGMMLLFPPDVSGWTWGTAWTSSEVMLKRSGLGYLLMGMDSKDHGGAQALAARILAQGAPANAEQMTDSFLRVLDGDLPAEKRAILVKVCEAGGGPASLKDGATAAPVLAEMCKLLFASPEFQFC